MANRFPANVKAIARVCHEANRALLRGLGQRVRSWSRQTAGVRRVECDLVTSYLANPSAQPVTQDAGDVMFLAIVRSLATVTFPVPVVAAPAVAALIGGLAATAADATATVEAAPNDLPVAVDPAPQATANV